MLIGRSLALCIVVSGDTRLCYMRQRHTEVGDARVLLLDLVGGSEDGDDGRER
jgi:hypothetical protein